MEAKCDGVEQVKWELIYRAPDVARMRVSGAGEDFDYWVCGSDFYMLKGGAWKEASLASLIHLQLLDESFPNPKEPEAGVCSYLTLRRDASGHADFSLSMGYVTSGRRTLLGWLENLRQWSGVTRDGGNLRWEDDGPHGDPASG